jgi:hypothetical protein
MNKYFLSQIIYDRFKLYTDIDNIGQTINKVKKEVQSKNISQTGLERVLKRNISRHFLKEKKENKI